MERSPRKRPEPAAIDITWVSCRGVRSSLPFHTPCLYASISVVTPSSAKGVHRRRPHRVKTPTDRAGGGNPEWDTPLRLYLPLPEAVASPPPPSSPAEAPTKNHDVGEGDVLVVRFEIKAEVAVLGDMLAASAAVAVTDLVPDGRTRRVSYQLVGPDGRSPNGVVSFSYAFHDRNAVQDDDGRSSSSSDAATPLAVYPPPLAETTTMASSCSVYPTAREATVAASGMYPTVDLAPVSCYPPPVTAPLYGVECGYAAAPGWDQRCMYG
ncbi:hypothetical protein HU200_038646 [Digitaria exilis]|uniref:C2 domain-containing protein n=1 Tax=Digitaria exilis TaxID=1010633 RepID=A0A835BCL2_9POAL|nr:hypothetical protein HU200_038646 [Digitaria exilis]